MPNIIDLNHETLATDLLKRMAKPKYEASVNDLLTRRRKPRVRRIITIVACVGVVIAAFGSCSYLNSEKVARALQGRSDFTMIKDACVSLTGLATTGDVTLRSHDPKVPPILRSLAPYNYPIQVRSDAVMLRIKDGWRGGYGFGFEIHQTGIIDWEIYYYYNGLLGSDLLLDEDGRSVRAVE